MHNPSPVFKLENNVLKGDMNSQWCWLLDERISMEEGEIRAVETFYCSSMCS